MPVTKSAKKSLRKDKKRNKINKVRKEIAKEAIKAFRKTLSEENFRKAVGLVDRLAKNKVIHKKKAARIKSRLTKLLSTKIIKKSQKSPTPAVKKVKKRIESTVNN